MKENLGVGPKRYCLVYENKPLNNVSFAIVMTFLPRHKMFVYPEGVRLDGMFMVEPWLTRGITICSRTSISAEEFCSYFPTEV